jgi:malate synthase
MGIIPLPPLMQTAPAPTATRLQVKGSTTGAYAHILTPQALAFIEQLEIRFGTRRRELLAARAERQKRLDAGERPGFLVETKTIRESRWTVAPAPRDLTDRRVEITGPVERKMIINALNSGARVFMADFEDSNTPTWDNTIQGQINLADAVRRTITFANPDGKQYKLNDPTATLVVRPRGWHLEEKHLLLDGKPISGSLTDFGLYFFHNAKELMARGSGPYFYLPKMESHLEARLWNDVFVFAQDYVGVPQGSIRATVLIETILAAFEMDEILYELRNHASGLNCGRWDYIFSFIKKFRNHAGFVLPDRAQVTMTTHFMRSYSLLAIQTCHKRGAHAMGGMAAQIPIKGDEQANAEAFARVKADKEREAGDGHDGTWVAHPGLVPVALEVFNRIMPQPNQKDRLREDVHITPDDLLQVHAGTITEKGLRLNIDVAIQYIESWLRGNGCVPIYNLMEDAATAEISRTQVWQWLHHQAKLDDGRAITPELYGKLFAEEVHNLRLRLGEDAYARGKYEQAAQLFDAMVRNPQFTEFLTLPAYDSID